MLWPSSEASSGSLDVRIMATAAKTLHELETLMGSANLMEIKQVSEHALSIQQFGQQLRRQAQEKLLASLKDRNQATVAASLQVCCLILERGNK